jgi:hypothetical protein
MKTTVAFGFFLALLSASAPVAVGAQSADAAAVVAVAAHAIGAARLRDVPSLHETVSGTAVGLPLSGDAYIDLAHRTFADYTHVGPLRQDQGFDGTDAWTRDNKGVVWVDASQQNYASTINEAYREANALFTPSYGGATVTLQPPVVEAGTTYDALRVVPRGSVVPFDVWIDRRTHLPMRYVETASAVTTTTTLGDYRAVAGMLVPFRQEQTTSQGNVTTMTIGRIEVAPTDIAVKTRKPATDVHDFAIAGGARETIVPFHLVDNHVAVDVMLDGKGPYHFLFDTGGANLIDPAVAKEIGSGTSGSMQGGGVGATSETFAFAKVSSLQIGDARLEDQDFIVVPVRAGFGVSGSEPVDGLIGAEVLARYVTTFDYTHGRLTFAMPGATASGVPIAMTFDGTQPLVPCRIDDVAAQCTIDSGSRSSLDVLTPFIASHPKVVPHDETAAGANGYGVGGASIGKLGRLGSLELGDYTMPDLIAGFSDATSGAFAVPGIAANIGGGVLKRFTVTFDYLHSRMYVRPDAAFAERDDMDHSGIFAIRQNGAIVVASVRDGTPAAEAGIVKGDSIAAIDATVGSALTLGGVRATFMRTSGTLLRLRIVRNGKALPKPIALTLKAYV